MAKDDYTSPIPRTAKGIQPHRYVGNGKTKAYEEIYFESKDPAITIDTLFHKMKSTDCISTSQEDKFGICNVLDKKGKTVHQFELTKKGLSWIYKKYNLRVVK